DADVADVLQIVSVTVDPLFGQAQIAPDARHITFTPAAELVGTARLSYKITDGRGGFAQSAVTVTIGATAGNLPPVAKSDFTTTAPGSSVDVAVVANDTDPENDPLTLSTATAPAFEGTVTFTGSIVSFTPAAGF